MTKRKKFILSAIVLSLGLGGIQLVNLEYRYLAIAIFGLFTYGVSTFALFEDLKGIEWLTILILPSFYAAAVGLFYFLLPENALTRIAILGLFGLGMYALYLTENIYSVAALRTIQLVRAANAVGFLMTILTLILMYNTIFSIRWSFYANGLLVWGLSWPVILQALWSVRLESKLSWATLIMSFGLSLALGELAVVLSLMPVTVWIASLFLGTLAYVSLGLIQHALSERLFARTIWEYLGVGILVLAATLVITPWR